MNRTRPHRSTRHGFTLMELVVSMAVASVLLAGMASTLFIALQAVDQDIGDIRRTQEAATIAFDMQNELALATAFSVLSAGAVEFTVPDRSGDMIDETIRYQWGGAGTPLERIYNNGSPHPLLPSANYVEFFYDIRSDSPADGESSETMLFDRTTGGTDASTEINHLEGIGTSLAPTLPADTSSWRVTRVQFRAKKSGSNTGMLKAQLVEVTWLGTFVRLLGEVSVLESSFGNSYDWHEVVFANGGGIDPANHARFLLVYDEAGSGSAGLIERTTGVSTVSSIQMTTSNGGATWTSITGEDIRYRMWGTHSTTVPVSSRLQSVEYRIESGAADTAIEAGARIPNRPIVSVP